MKKWMALLLATVMLLGLTACGGGAENQPEAPAGLQVGFGKQDITPDTTRGILLQGGDYKNRPSEGLLDKQYVTCIALKEGEQTVLIFTMDYKVATHGFVEPAKILVSGATGIDKANITFNATHTHASAAVRYKWDGVEPVKEKFNTAAVAAAQEALADLSGAEVYAGSIQTEGLAFVRHYLMDDGTITSGGDGTHAVKHLHDADTELQVVKFARAAQDKKDIVLLSFPSHATCNEGGLNLSADYPAPLRDYVAEQTGTLVAFFQGASGDQSPKSKVGKDYNADYRDYGKRIGEYAVRALEDLHKLEGQTVNISTKTFTGPVNKKNVDKIVQAKEVQTLAQNYGQGAPQTQEALKKYGFATYHEANWTVIRSNAGDTMSMDLVTVRVGDGLAFIMAPYEMFGQHGAAIKEKSPFDTTFIITCSDEASPSYIASTEAFDYNSYESYCTYYEQGTGEKLVEEYVAMLTEMKG